MTPSARISLGCDLNFTRPCGWLFPRVLELASHSLPIGFFFSAGDHRILPDLHVVWLIDDISCLSQALNLNTGSYQATGQSAATGRKTNPFGQRYDRKEADGGRSPEL